jgi:predicted nicotinamide N-methyase
MVFVSSSIPTLAPPTSRLCHERVAQRLLWRLASRYVTVTKEVTVAGLQLSFTLIANPDAILDQVAAEEDRLERISGKRKDGDYLHLPYWAELWDSAAGLAQLLPSWGRTSAGLSTSALDLGCGMGLAGTVAARLGMRVMFADLEPPALLFAQLNSLPDRERVRTRRLDWRTDRLNERFDLILGGDILYERKQWDHLEPFWRTHLAPGGTVLLGEPGRQSGDLFDPWIRARGWQVQVRHEPVVTREQPIRIFILRPPPVDPSA